MCRCGAGKATAIIRVTLRGSQLVRLWHGLLVFN